MVRPIEPDDVATLMALIRDLAVYELEPDAVESTDEDLRRALFASNPQVFAHVAVADGRVVGAAVWTVSFSTWTGRHGVHLVDLIVDASARAAGHGVGLLRELARICLTRGYARLDWEVLDALENGDAEGRRGPHGFYRRQGAAPRHGWTAWRLDATGLAALADS